MYLFVIYFKVSELRKISVNSAAPSKTNDAVITTVPVII